MTRKTTYLTLFLLAVMATVAILQYGLDRFYVSHVDNKINALFQHRIDSDIMVFGSSVAYTDVNPDTLAHITRHGCFNMGAPGMNFAQYESLILEFAENKKKCRYIVMCFDYGSFCAYPSVAWPHLFYSYLQNNDHVYAALYSIDPSTVLLEKYVPGYKLAMLNKEFYSAILSGKLDFKRGFVPKSNARPVPGSIRPDYIPFDPKVYGRTKKCLALLTRRDIKVFMVFNPVSADLYQQTLNPDMLKRKLRSLVSKDVYFLDYSADSMNGNASYFYDHRHLNGRGAKLFSRKLAQDMAAIMVHDGK